MATVTTESPSKTATMTTTEPTMLTVAAVTSGVSPAAVTSGVSPVAENSSKFSCRYCQKTYSSQPSLRIHEKWHTGDLKHKCNFCVKRFRNPSEVKRHEMTHTGRKEEHAYLPYCNTPNDLQLSNTPGTLLAVASVTYGLLAVLWILFQIGSLFVDPYSEYGSGSTQFETG